MTPEPAIQATNKSNTCFSLFVIIGLLLIMQYMQYRYNIILLEKVTLQTPKLTEISISEKNNGLPISAGKWQSSINFINENKLLSFIVGSTVTALAFAIKIGFSSHGGGQ